MEKRRQSYLLGLVFILVLLGCGEEMGGGVGVFDTVTVTASTATINLDSDVATWTDIDGDKLPCGPKDTFVTSPDDVNLDITVKTKNNLPATIKASKIRIDKVTITYTPANTSTPSLQTQFATVGNIIDPDNTKTLSIRVASQELKLSLLPSLKCTATIFTYFVTLTFEGIEVDSNKSANMETSLNVRFADFFQVK